VFAAVFIVTFLLVVIMPPKESLKFPVYPFNPFVVLLGAAACVALTVWIYHLLCGFNFKNKRFFEITCLFFMFAIYIIIQLYVAREIETEFVHGWDFGTVVRYARDYVEFDIPGGVYLSDYPNNIPLYLLLTLVFRLAKFCGIDYGIAGIIFNIVMIDTALLVLYLCAKKMRGRKTAFIILLAALFTVPILLYVAIYYTDTVTMVFPIGAFYIWLFVKEKIAENKRYKACILIVLLAVVVAVGALLKMTVAIVGIAILIDAALSFKLKKAIAVAVLAVVVFAGVFVPANAAMPYAKSLEPPDASRYFPSSHWIMMGLNGVGSYNSSDIAMVENMPLEQRDKLVGIIIKERIREKGFFGMLKHLGGKVSFTWGEGTFSAPYKVRRDRMEKSSLDRYWSVEGENYAAIPLQSQFMMVAMIAGLILAGIRLMRKKPGARDFLVCLVAIFGLFVFLLIWETRSRYLTNYIPIMLLVCIPAVIESAKEIIARIKKCRKA
jgi:hypothetical protein